MTSAENKPHRFGVESCIPAATYRLQFNSGFAFQQALAVCEYLHELGISHVYASPLFKATPGSTHGYDVCGLEQFNPELGTSEQFERFSDKLHGLGMELLLDIVPNHMAASAANSWWMDVLEHGSRSAYAGYFDIDWEAPG